MNVVFSKLVSLLRDITATVGKTPPYRAVQSLKIRRSKQDVALCTLDNVVLNFTKFCKILKNI